MGALAIVLIRLDQANAFVRQHQYYLPDTE
ncbi:hypothetical protein MMMDOFMJ_3431 [Methylobacterium gnaphalii]|nr:hypothetical protein MMMDOFMJ_3431 [Methylobacterium gnaphalii]